MFPYTFLFMSILCPTYLPTKPIFLLKRFVASISERRIRLSSGMDEKTAMELSVADECVLVWKPNSSDCSGWSLTVTNCQVTVQAVKLDFCLEIINLIMCSFQCLTHSLNISKRCRCRPMVKHSCATSTCSCLMIGPVKLGEVQEWISWNVKNMPVMLQQNQNSDCKWFQF